MSGRLKIIDLLEADRRAVLFLDAANARCSQMAEGFASYLSPASMRIYSAGIAPTAMDAMSVAVMRESGIDISEAIPKGLDAIDMEGIAVVVSLCATELVPELPEHVKHVPVPLQDPSGSEGPRDALLEAYRNARNQVRELVSTLL